MHFMLARVAAKLMHSLAAAFGNKLADETLQKGFVKGSPECAALKQALDYGIYSYDNLHARIKHYFKW